MDYRALGLPGCTTSRAEVVAGDPCLLQLQDEELFTDLRVVVVDPVLTGVLAHHLLAERDHLGSVLVERLGLRYVMLVVPLEHFDLLTSQRGAHLERQILDAVRAHVELKRLQTCGAGLVVEVVDLVQVHLLNIAVSRVDLMRPLVILIL